ncbi:MAG: sigma-54-dependent Fis family transcriptional regulator [Deltaproteobacteria bacterium]|jgi:DNA-binding NtrC family response regulator|nr:sigma-54-dependent Fis family transcriptional regulator [Deltaproteobacteria bacterium]
MESFPNDPLVMLVEDDPDQRALVGQWLRDEGMRTVECPDAETFLDSLDLTLPDVVCLDLGLPGINGRQALEAVQRQHPDIPVLMVTADASAQSVIDAMRSGASDYLTKPVDRTTMLGSVQRALVKSRERSPVRIEDSEEPSSYAGVLGRSPQMREVFRQVDRIAGRDISVLIRGDSGTGKELIARAIHENSRRAGGPFVALNCAAIPESLQDSELFGHERGSFTGAHKARAGCFERADGGTLFLDEVGELSLAVQAKLLRVLQERRFDRVGGARTVESDFRLITATHRDLRSMVEANRFREDLYFRIVVFEVELPPLRMRDGDLRLLVPTLLEEIAASLGGEPLQVSEAAMHALESYSFPGNVRELENILQCAAVLAAGNEIALRDLPARVRGSRVMAAATPSAAATAAVTTAPSNEPGAAPSEEEPQDDPAPGAREQLPLNLEALERWAVERALRDKNGRLTETAKALGIGRTTLYRKLEKYGLR